jgi:DNA repair exonuclease SbcCD nuclease subunit|tara:strand:- start:7703 stop:8710 length:1008 start_codon:yes stop_codon:yes gene_type:complete
LFKKLAVFTDIHFGLKSNSKIHNDDCEAFVDWYIEQAKKEGCETGMFCGDWHHNRNSVNITTMDASIRCLEKIGKAFDKFYFFPGNHDLYFKDSRSIQSTEFGRFIPGITMVNEIMNVDDVVMVPWLVGDEWRKVGKMKCKYMFGHFELPNFFMNAMVEMPDTGELKGSDFQNQEYVFSGHFHKRQVKNNIHYLGNAFPHNYADVDDNDRGMMILEWDKEPRYLNWHDCPKYKYVKLSELLDKTKEIMQPKIHLRVTLDIDISYEEASFIKETFMKEYDCREITLIPSKKDEEINSDLDLTKFESVDEIVAKELDSIESDNYNKKTLMDIYNDLG